jgi:23S rRNA (pseudouridine1915-N3)-methyltransferase
MKVSIIAVGKLGQDPENVILQRYIKRIPWQVSLQEVAEKRPVKGQERCAREAELLRGKLPKGAFLVALDEKGREYTSEALAAAIDGWRNRGVNNLAFMIGGAGGLDSRLRDSADIVMSLGRMTWPHALVRAMLAEQLYRASAILDGHPYHRG